MPSVYVEMSVFGALVDRREDQTSRYQHAETLRWWRNRDRFDLFCSQAVIEEFQQGFFDGQSRAIAAAAMLVPLEMTSEAVGLAKAYRDQLIMPSKEGGDALHLALASYHAIDYLLTWNCKHLANPSKIGRIGLVNAAYGFPIPRMLTPPLLVGAEQ